MGGIVVLEMIVVNFALVQLIIIATWIPSHVYAFNTLLHLNLDFEEKEINKISEY
ncbi:hypothetical protein Lalb_Chr18g0051081 [Lupinus albus]|uniref:Uncharacterized protein n=1 Tax=Lupinus albus TaxID=3870 RepID=A0A6A4NYG9_LUPAL|nr:hypothetical protein Lalb_Chr18g0051081 [Lupinus albus]